MEEQEFTNKDIPIETLLRYIIRDRDAYKEKLRGMTIHASELESQNKSLKQKNEDLNKRISQERNETQRTPAYKQLFEKYTRLKRDNENLISQICQLRSQKNDGFLSKLFKKK